MKLEAVNPVDPEEVCIATVTKLKDSYLWLQLEGKLGLGEERSALFGSAVVPSPNLRSIRSKLTVCRVWAASHNFLSEITVKTHLHCVFAGCLGWHCLYKPRMAFVQCQCWAHAPCKVLSGAVWKAGALWQFHTRVSCILSKLWPDLGRKVFTEVLH